MLDVSIIIPTHNRAGWLAETIESAKRAASSAEILVIDDASTDSTPEICRSIEGIRYIRLEKNVGASAARNLGVKESAFDLVAFLDDDDLRLPDSLEGQLHLLERSPNVGLVYGRALLGEPRFSLPTGMVVPPQCPTGDVFWPLLEGNFIATSTVVARKQALVEAGLFDVELETLEDYDLWVRVAERFEVGAVEDPVAIYRVRSVASGQKTSDRAAHDRLHKQLHRKMLRSPRALAGPLGQRRRTHRRHMGVIYGSLIQDAALAFIDGNARAARAYLLAAVRLRPLHLKAHVSLLWLLARNMLHGAH